MILVDYSNLSIVTLMGELKGDTEAEIELSVFRNLVLRQILEFRQKYHQRFGEPVICADGNDYWRKHVFEYYKHGRKKAKKDSDYDWDRIKLCQNTLLDELRRFFPYPVVEVASAEADDAIAILAKWSQTNDLKREGLFDSPKESVIISADGDFVQLQEYKGIKQFSPLSREQVKPDMPLDRFCLEHVLTGDATDGVMNINTPSDFFYIKEQNPDSKERQKPVTAKMKDYYYDQILEHGEIKTWLKPEHEENFKRNSELVLFENIPQYVTDQVIDAYKKQLNKGRGKILPYLRAANLRNLLSEADEF